MELFRRLKIPETKVLAKLTLSSKENVESSTSGESPPNNEKPRIDDTHDANAQQKGKQKSRGKQPIAPKPLYPPLKQGAGTNKIENGDRLAQSSLTDPKPQGGNTTREATRSNTVPASESYLPPQIQTRSVRTPSHPKLNSLEQRARRKADPPGCIKRHPSVTTTSIQGSRPFKSPGDKSKRHSPSSIERRRMRRGNSLSPSGSSGKPKIGRGSASERNGEPPPKMTVSSKSPIASRGRPQVPILRSLELALVGGSDANQFPQISSAPEINGSLPNADSTSKARTETTPWVLQSPSGVDMKRPIGSLLGATDLIGELDEIECATPRIRNRLIDVDTTEIPSCTAIQSGNPILDSSVSGESLCISVEDNGHSSNHNMSNSMSNNMSTGDLSLDQSTLGGSQYGDDATGPCERRRSAAGGIPSSPSRTSSDAAVRRRRVRSTSRSRSGDQTDARSTAGSEQSSSSPRSRLRRRSRSRSRSRSRTRSSQTPNTQGSNDLSTANAPPSPTRRPARSPKAGPPVTKRTPAQKLSMKYAMKAADLDIAPLQPTPPASFETAATSPGLASTRASLEQIIAGVERDLVDSHSSTEPQPAASEADSPTSSSAPASSKKLEPMRALLKRIPSATGLVGNNARGMLKRCSSFSGLHTKRGGSAPSLVPATGAAIAVAAAPPDAPEAAPVGHPRPDHLGSGQREDTGS